MENSIIPTICPHCGTELTFDGIHLKCPNESCEGKKLQKFKDACVILDIKGLGPEMATKFFNAGLKSVFDIFIPSRFLPVTHKVWDKNVEKVVNGLNTLKGIELWKVIMLNCFEGVGESTAKQLAMYSANKYFGKQTTYDFTGLNRAVVDEYIENGYKAVNEFMSDLTECVEGGGFIIMDEGDNGGNGVGVEFTGSPKPFFKTKEEFLSAIKSKGFTHTKLTDAKILVTDSYASTSSKMTTAKKKGVEIITYDDFIKKYLK